MAWYTRLMIMLVVALVVYLGFWYFVTSGTRAETREINAQVENLRRQNMQAQIAQQRLNDIKAMYKARQEEYDDLKALLPEQRELTSILQGLQDRARTSHLTLTAFTPKPDVDQELYTGKPIEVQVTSTFGNLREFFNQIAHYQRIVSVTDFRIEQVKQDEEASNRTVNSKFLLTAYYSSPERLQNNQASAPGQKPGQQSPQLPQQLVVTPRTSSATEAH